MPHSSLHFISTLAFSSNDKILQKRLVYVKESKTYVGSSAHCKSVGGSLATPESEEENQQMLDELSNSPRCFFIIHLFFIVDT